MRGRPRRCSWACEGDARVAGCRVWEGQGASQALPSLAAGTGARFTLSVVLNLSYNVGGSNRTYPLRLLGLNELLRVTCVTKQRFAQRKCYIGFAIIII